MSAELTGFTKANGPLTKRISLAADGTVKSDGSACVMAHGTAQRLRVADVGELAAVMESIRSDQAIALGALRTGLPDKVQIVTKQKLNGQADTIARTGGDIAFRKEKPALALIDFDAKGMPSEIVAEMQRVGGFLDDTALRIAGVAFGSPCHPPFHQRWLVPLRHGREIARIRRDPPLFVRAGWR